MNPDTRMAASLVLSLAVSMPNLLRVLAGEADILPVGIRYIVAFLLAFFGVGMVGGLYNRYLVDRDDKLAEIERAKAEIEAMEATAGEPRRRAEDVDA